MTPEEIQRQAQIRALNGGPTSNTMPIGGKPPGVSGTMPVGGTQKRDQWSGVGSVTGGNLGNVEGFDAANFADPNMQTAKYQAGRIFSRYDPNDAGALEKILGDAEFKSVFANAKGMGPDKIDFGDGRPVDMIRGHGAPGAKFSWQTEDAPSAAAGGQGMGQPMGMSPTSDNSALAKIMEELAAAQQGAESPTERDALMALLQGVI